MGAVSVYLADLRYNYSGVLATDCMPTGVAYMKAVMDERLPEVKSRLFAYPDRLWGAIQTDPPDVLMVSNYCWNEALSLHFGKLVKRMRPETLVVMGGPNISLEEERQVACFQHHPEIDVYVRGEGDFLATEVVQHFLDAGLSIRKLGEREIPSSIYRRADGQIVTQKIRERQRQLDDIPSPWLSGALDEFFDGKLAPLIETNRGCPFSCTFCVQGERWYTKVNYFSTERIKNELEYIARRIAEVCPWQGVLRIADSNFGMYERDGEISDFIGRCQKIYGYPQYVDATTGKNRPERVIRAAESMNGAMLLDYAVQSLDEGVLRNVKRQTVKLEAYEQLHAYVRGRGLRSNSDLILCLPGETLQSHLAAARKLVDSGFNQVTNFQLMMLKGSELETIASRREFSFVSRYRVLPKNFGIYGDEKVFDVEEIVVATDTLLFEDYVTCRKLALCSVVFWHDDLFEEVAQFLARFGVKRSECWEAMLPELENSSGTPRRFLEDFVGETVGELFPTREACIEFYSREENFDRLARGKIGENLIQKYHALAVFHLWPEICDVAMRGFEDLLLKRDLVRQIPDFPRFWADLCRYTSLRHAHGRTVEVILAPARGSFRYDIPRWLTDEMPADPSPYRFVEPEELEFHLGPEGTRGLRDALEVWSTQVRGLGKLLTRIKLSWLTRECRHSGQPGRPAGGIPVRPAGDYREVAGR